MIFHKDYCKFISLRHGFIEITLCAAYIASYAFGYYYLESSLLKTALAFIGAAILCIILAESRMRSAKI